MAFNKTGISVTQPQVVVLEEKLTLKVGDERDGKVWDGEKWVSKAEWEARESKPHG
jgi:hypothetical protein